MAIHAFIFLYLTIQITLSDVLVVSSFFFLIMTIKICNFRVIQYDNSSNKTYETFPDEESNFNPSIPSEGILVIFLSFFYFILISQIQGYITTVNPPGGCSRIDRPPNIATFGFKWIALIPRVTSGEGSCEFVTKVNFQYFRIRIVFYI